MATVWAEEDPLETSPKPTVLGLTTSVAPSGVMSTDTDSEPWPGTLLVMVSCAERF